MSNIKASTLRLTLTVSMFLIGALAVVMFYFANQHLSEVATDVSRIAADAEASQNNLQTLQTIEQKLSNEQQAIDRAQNIVAESQSYQYQDQILSDLNSYAARSGVSITNINFSTGDGSVAASSGGEAAVPAPGAAAAPAGLKTTSVSVTIDNPVNYNNLLRFMRSIEQNLTKMQLSSVSLSKGESGNQVTSDALNIEVYIR